MIQTHAHTRRPHTHTDTHRFHFDVSKCYGHLMRQAEKLDLVGAEHSCHLVFKISPLHKHNSLGSCIVIEYLVESHSHSVEFRSMRSQSWRYGTHSWRVETIQLWNIWSRFSCQVADLIWGPRGTLPGVNMWPLPPDVPPPDMPPMTPKSHSPPKKLEPI